MLRRRARHCGSAPPELLQLVALFLEPPAAAALAAACPDAERALEAPAFTTAFRRRRLHCVFVCGDPPARSAEARRVASLRAGARVALVDAARPAPGPRAPPPADCAQCAHRKEAGTLLREVPLGAGCSCCTQGAWGRGGAAELCDTLRGLAAGGWYDAAVVELSPTARPQRLITLLGEDPVLRRAVVLGSVVSAVAASGLVPRFLSRAPVPGAPPCCVAWGSPVSLGSRMADQIADADRVAIAPADDDSPPGAETAAAELAWLLNPRAPPPDGVPGGPSPRAALSAAGVEVWHWRRSPTPLLSARFDRLLAHLLAGCLADGNPRQCRGTDAGAARGVLRVEGFAVLSQNVSRRYSVRVTPSKAEVVDSGEWGCGSDRTVSPNRRQHELIFLGEAGVMQPAALELALESCVATPRELECLEEERFVGDLALSPNVAAFDVWSTPSVVVRAEGCCGPVQAGVRRALAPVARDIAENATAGSGGLFAFFCVSRHGTPGDWVHRCTRDLGGCYAEETPRDPLLMLVDWKKQAVTVPACGGSTLGAPPGELSPGAVREFLACRPLTCAILPLRTVQ
eukprot:TRINITY_DN14027_c0_g1_i2.p1 TRINITY_DN14027_c0_g1~~TRINITY_DN14027_c0_g1_i2.p1  ORF type:complete len:592 (+),score=139.42 TRINITY_DN14027_c0_g1_i2:62-1777(+)